LDIPVIRGLIGLDIPVLRGHVLCELQVLQVVVWVGVSGQLEDLVERVTGRIRSMLYSDGVLTCE